MAPAAVVPIRGRVAGERHALHFLKFTIYGLDFRQVPGEMQGLKKLTKEKPTSSVNDQRQQEYSIGYEAYRHFAFFAGLLLQANAPNPTNVADLVKWYLTEKAYCVPRDLPRPLVPRVYSALVHNLILDSCVEVVEDPVSGLQLLPNKLFLLWAWRDFALDFDVRMNAIPF